MSGFGPTKTQTEKWQLVRPVRMDLTSTRPAPMVSPLLLRQQPAGNQAMLRLAQSCPLTLPSASLCPTGGVCHTCPGKAQAKLTINQPGDKYEKEADQVAEWVMRMPESGIAGQANVSGPKENKYLQLSCVDCEEELRRQLIEEEEEELVQAKETSGLKPELTPGIQASVDASRGDGQPLPQSIRSFFEPRFGYDFSRVRIHNDGRAAEVAQTVNAQAFTIGRDIVFGEGQYAPGTSAGRNLLAHELTHIVQQSSGLLIQRQMASTAGHKTEPGPYIPGKMSLLYEGLTAAERAKVNEEVDRIFIKETGISRKLDRGDPRDLPLIRRWLQIRDDVMRKSKPQTPTPAVPSPPKPAPAVPPPHQQFFVCARPLQITGGVYGNHAYIDAPPYRYAIISPLCKPRAFLEVFAGQKWDNSPDPCGKNPTCIPCRPRPGLTTSLADCLRTQFLRYGNPSEYDLLGPNSNTFAGTLARACCANMVPRPAALGSVPGWDDPPARRVDAVCPPGGPSC